MRDILLALEKMLRNEKLAPGHPDHRDLIEALPSFASSDVFYALSKLQEAGYISADLEESENGATRIRSIIAITESGRRFMERYSMLLDDSWPMRIFLWVMRHYYLKKLLRQLARLTK